MVSLNMQGCYMFHKLMRNKTALFIIVFLAGFLTNSIFGTIIDNPVSDNLGNSGIAEGMVVSPILDGPEENQDTSAPLQVLLSSVPGDLPSPLDRITEDQIHVYDDHIVIDLDNAEWATFTDTNSMDPVIDEGSNAIEIIPHTFDEVHVGDIISYKSKYAPGTIIHRVVEAGFDEIGWYCIVKGDNLDANDPGKIRFDQIQRIVVAIIY